MTATDKNAPKATAEPSTPPTEPNQPVESLQATEAAAGDEGVDEKWKSVLIVADGDVPAKSRRAVIVVQNTKRSAPSSSPKGEPDFGTHRNPSQAPVANKSYPKGADVYFAVDEVDFGADRTPVIGVGMSRGVVQTGFPGFAERLGQVHVGPSSPIFAAANYAYTRGAKKIEIVGLSPEQIESLRPYFTEVGDKVEISYGG